MTSVPPEPPAGSEPSATPPPSPATPAPPPVPVQPAQSSGGGFTASSVNPMDWGILAVGVLALIFSTFNYYTLSVKGFGSDSESAWHGFFGWFAALVALAASILLAVHLFAPSVKMRFPVRLVVLGAYAVSLICMIIAGFVTPGAVSSGEASAAVGFKVSVDYGRGAGFYLSLIAILAGTVLAFLRLRETGGKLPWDKSA